MPILLKTRVKRTAKTLISARRARVGGLCGFRSTAERRTHPAAENQTLCRRAGALAKNARIGKNGSGKAACGKCRKTLKRSKSRDFERRGEKAARKQEKGLTLFCASPSTSARSASSFEG